MSEPIRLITDKTELNGTCYFEIMAGKYVRPVWNDGSVFIDDEVFSLIEPVFEKNIPDFNRYTFKDVGKKQWEGILTDLSIMKNKISIMKAPSELPGTLGYISDSRMNDFLLDFESNQKDIIVLIDSLSTWIHVNLANHDYLSVLGL